VGKHRKTPCIWCGKRFVMTHEREAAHLGVCPIYQNLPPMCQDEIQKALDATVKACTLAGRPPVFPDDEIAPEGEAAHE